jgi:hypothetical protein
MDVLGVCVETYGGWPPLPAARTKNFSIFAGIKNRNYVLVCLVDGRWLRFVEPEPVQSI